MLFYTSVITDDRNLYGYHNLTTQVHIDLYGLYMVNYCLCNRTALQIFKYLQRRQRMSLIIKQSLIIPGRTAIILTCILRIISCRIAGCPAGALTLPGLLIVCKNLRRIIGRFLIHINRNPGRLPIEITDTGLTNRSHGRTDIPDFMGLSLYGCRIFRQYILFSDTVGITVSVSCRIGVGILRHHDFFPIFL